MRILLAPTVALYLVGCSAFTPTPVAQQHAAPPPPAPAAVDSTMTRDDTADIQGRLRDAGFYKGPIDGKWGPATEAALRGYQRDRQLDATGRMTPETHSRLYP
jgi:peptidoglycan hydrolase-like protein with peptidoglycan-binding domain